MKPKTKLLGYYIFIPSLGIIGLIVGLTWGFCTFLYPEETKSFVTEHHFGRLVYFAISIVILAGNYLHYFFKLKNEELEHNRFWLNTWVVFFFLIFLFLLLKFDLIFVFLVGQFSIFFFGLHHFRKNQQKLEKREKGLIGFSLLFLVLLPFVFPFFLKRPVVQNCPEQETIVDFTEKNDKDWTGTWVLQNTGDSTSGGIVIIIDKGDTIDGYYIKK